MSNLDHHERCGDERCAHSHDEVMREVEALRTRLDGLSFRQEASVDVIDAAVGRLEIQMMDSPTVSGLLAAAAQCPSCAQVVTLVSAFIETQRAMARTRDDFRRDLDELANRHFHSQG